MTDRVEVTSVEGFEPGDREIVEADSRSIGVFNVGGDYFALRNHCPHDSGPVCTGRVRSRLTGTYEAPGERITEAFDGAPSITCPWHGWEYDVETGTHVGDESISLQTYDVVVEDGTVYVEL